MESWNYIDYSNSDKRFDHVIPCNLIFATFSSLGPATFLTNKYFKRVYLEVFIDTTSLFFSKGCKVMEQIPYTIVIQKSGKNIWMTL